MNKKISLLLLTAIGTALAGVSVQAAELTGTLKMIKDTGTIALAHRESSVPFSYYDDKQQVIGYSHELAMKVVEAVKKELKAPNLKVTLNPVTPATRIPLVSNGTVDLSGYSHRPHHFAFPLLLLVFALALATDALPPRGRLAAAAAAALFWATLGARLPSAVYPVDASPDKDRLLAAVREKGLDRSTLQLHSSWGTYYTSQLFGDPERMVVYARRAVEDPERLRQVAELGRRAGRPLLLFSSRRWDRLHTPEVEAVLGRPERTWQFGSWWAVQYAPTALPSLPP